MTEGSLVHVCCPRVFSSIAYNWMEYHVLFIGVLCKRARIKTFTCSFSRFQQFMKPGAYGRYSNFFSLKISTFQMFRGNLDWNLDFWMKHQCTEMLIFPGTNAVWAWILSHVFLSQAKTSADKSFLAYPTGTSMNPTGARKYRLTRGSVRPLVHDVSTSIAMFRRHFACFNVMFTSFSAKCFNDNILDRNRTKQFLIEKCSYFCIKLIT